jgi:hypothetical protein
MRIQLDSEWIVDCDALSCNLIRLRTITAGIGRGRAAKAENIGQQREEVVGFYGSYQHACEAYLLKKTQGSSSTTAEELVAIAEACVNAVIEATKGISKEVVTSK